MIKLVLAATVPLGLIGSSAMAGEQVWNVTEVAESVPGAQGQWHLTVDGEKASGKANLQTHTGALVTYGLEGTLGGAQFAFTMTQREDGKNGCAVSGHTTLNDDQRSHRFVGEVRCEHNVKFYVKGGF